MERLNLNCISHGDYQKFDVDQNKSCPYCAKEKEELKDLNAVKNIKLPLDLFIDVQIKCEVHGEKNMSVPKILAKKLQYCPECIEENHLKKLKKHVDKYIHQVLIDSGIPLNSFGMSFTKVDRNRSEKQTRIIERLIKYICDVVGHGDSHGAKNILLTGNMGTGKTLFASILLQNIALRSLADNVLDKNDIRLKSGLAFFFMSEQLLQASIISTWGKNGGTEKIRELYERLSNKAILCIDDVGTVTSTQTHLLDAYAAILDERYKRNLPTIITSNVTHEGLKHVIGARSADRFLEKNRVIVANFDWKGYRESEQGSHEIEIF